MTFLPIVTRELRLAARKRSTFWVRVAAAITAVIIAGAFMMLAVVSFGAGTAGFGSALFATLTWLSVAAVLSAGVFFTSDCLSEEKREGTLGFLFLTDLRGYDVVLGKLLATSLRGFYAFLAVFPVLATTLLMGGVTGAQFWKTTLALVNALFLSLAIGMLISAISRDSQKALAGTLIALVLLSATGPAVDGIVSQMKQSSFHPVLSLASPVYVFAIAGAWGPSAFWKGLLANQIVAWSALGLASLLLPWAWQERGSSSARRNWMYWWRFGGAKRRARLRGKLLGRDPMLWLATRERWQAAALWAVCLLTAIAIGVTLFTYNDIKVWLTWNYLGGVVSLLLYLMVASQASRFFVHAKKSGVLELLLSTPLPAAQIIHGQGRALVRMFLVPLALYLATQLLASIMAQQAFKDIAASVPNTPLPTITTNTIQTNATTLLVTTNVAIVPPTPPAPVATSAASDGPGWFLTILICLGATLATGTNLIALWWFGMWMGLTSRTANMATLKTLLFVQVIPWFVIVFGGWMVVQMTVTSIILVTNSPRGIVTWTPLLGSAFAALLAIGKDIGFVVLARKRLYGQLRLRAAEIGNYVLPPITPAPLSRPRATQP